jgi:hypothetical protein
MYGPNAGLSNEVKTQALTFPLRVFRRKVNLGTDYKVTDALFRLA